MRIVGFILLILSSVSFAQDYPARSVTAVIPFSTGSASDVIARLVLERMGTAMGQRFIVTNIPPCLAACEPYSALKPIAFTTLLHFAWSWAR